MIVMIRSSQVQTRRLGGEMNGFRKLFRDYIRALLLLVVSGFLALSYAEEIPLPPDAEQIGLRENKTGPISSIFINYKTSMDKNKLTNFYRKELTKAGWTERSNPALHFLKNDSFFTIKILPVRVNGNKTAFTIIRGNIPNEDTLQESKKDKPDAVNFMPIYPNAKQSYLWDSPSGAVAAYKTQDKIEDVVSFYKSKMPGYGWFLQSDMPVQEEKFTEGCVSCNKKPQKDKNATGESIQVDGVRYSAKLLFKRKNGDNCILNIRGVNLNFIGQNTDFNIPGKEKITNVDIPVLGRETNILVSYNEYKKMRR